MVLEPSVPAQSAVNPQIVLSNSLKEKGSLLSLAIRKAYLLDTATGLRSALEHV